MNPSCATCRFSAPTVFGDGEAVLLCRRYPPTLTISAHDGDVGEGASGWPPVDADDWCGEWAEHPR